jgi:hypothetical protein
VFLKIYTPAGNGERKPLKKRETMKYFKVALLQTSLTLPSELDEQLHQRAKETDLSKSLFICAALKYFLELDKKTQNKAFVDLPTGKRVNPGDKLKAMVETLKVHPKTTPLNPDRLLPAPPKVPIYINGKTRLNDVLKNFKVKVVKKREEDENNRSPKKNKRPFKKI